jgi:hypothetical protein
LILLFGAATFWAGRQIPDRDEAIATLFYACHPKLVRTGYSLAGDWAVTEEMAQEAFVRQWHRWRGAALPDRHDRGADVADPRGVARHGQEPDAQGAAADRRAARPGVLIRRGQRGRLARHQCRALAGNVSGQPEHLVEINPVTGRIIVAFTMQVYAIAGAVWEPTAQRIIRSNPARMPG